MIKENESICSKCGRKTNDESRETIFDDDADPYCVECYREKYGEDERYQRHIRLLRSDFPGVKSFDVAKTIDWNPTMSIAMKTKDGRYLAPSPFQVIEASKRKPTETHDFGINEETALKFRENKLREGKTALLGSKKVDGRTRHFYVEVY
jgi:hypothetical protein